MILDDATNPVAADDTAPATVADDTGVDTEAADDQPELDEDGNPIDPPDDSEEIELEGQKYKVPKALKPLMLMQADYTKKTQGLAEERTALQAERQSLHQTSQGELDAYAFVKNAEAQIAYYQGTDWDAWEQNAMYNDEEKARLNSAWRQFQQAKDARQNGINTLSNLRGQRQSAAQQETAKRIEEGKTVLSREVPGWNDEHKAKLIDFAAGYGFNRSELSDLEADPRVAKVLDAAFRGSEATRKANAANRHVAAQQVQPAAKVAASKAPASGLDDRASTDVWMKARTAQTRKRA